MTAATSSPVDAVIFDLGGVCIQWDPRRLFRTLLPDDAAVEAFLEEVAFLEWNALHDAGQPFAQGVAELSRRFPHHAELIAAYPERFAETLGGPIAGTVEVVEQLHRDGVRLLALTNWSAEVFHHGRAQMPFLDGFEAVVVSGELRMAKPDPRIFRHVVDRFDLDPPRTVFIDDSPANVAAAEQVGLDAIRFTDPAALRAALVSRGLLAAAT
ncbi:MAG: HAD family phosphatase [Actinomycetota bacterium]|nr:HAD family phosphatase [Actinomycetota bacterium]